MDTNRTTLTVYTDGAASGNPGPAGWAVLINGELHSDWLPNATNNQMELFAIYQAVDFSPPNVHLNIVSDSKLAIGWLSKGWRRNNPHIDQLVGIILHIAALKGVTLSFTKTKGHAYDKLNNRVDKAAHARSQQAKAYR